MNAAIIAITLLYPVFVYYTHDRLEPRAIAIALVCVVAARLVVVFTSAATQVRPGPQHIKWIFAILGVFALGVTAINSLGALLYYPVLVNVLMLLIFGHSLVRPPSIIERLARIREPHLPDRAVRYTRAVTAIWCAFFVLNGAIAAWTAAFATLATWSLYNGLIAYLLMGLLFAGEWIVRPRVHRS